MAKNTVELFFLGDSKSAQRAIGDLSKSLSKQQTELERNAAAMSAWGGKLTKGVTAPLLGAAAGVGAAAMEVDKAESTIRRGTGATGDALAGLVTEFEDVARTVPASMGDVSSAIADLNTRTGATGDTLEELARQEVNLARVAGEDLSGLIKSTTRVFGDWSIATEDQAGTLDELWKVSQSTGITVGKLSDQLVQFGAPLRQLGFSLEETAALLGSFEKNGVNAELVMGSLRIALGKMAREGEPAVETFQRVVESIENAGSASEANAMALELFGARAGPDMAAAIREGRFEVDELMASIAGSDETIQKASDDSQTFGESLKIMGNQAALAVAPLGQELVGAAEDLMPALEGALGLVADGVDTFRSLPTPVQQSAVALLAVAAAAGPMLTLGGNVLLATGRLKDMHAATATLRGLAGKTTPTLGAVGGALGAIAAAGVIAVKVYSDLTARKREVAERTDELTETLDENTLAFTENTEAQILDSLVAGGHDKTIRELGLTIRDVTDAVLGNEEALAKVESATDDALDAEGALRVGMDGRTVSMDDSSRAALDLAQAIGIEKEAAEASLDVKRREVEAAAELEGRYHDLEHAISSGLTGTQAALALALQETTDAAEGTTDAMGDQEGAVDDVAGATGDMTAATDDSTAALDEQQTQAEEATSALQLHADTLRAQLDPIFGVSKAIRDHQQALVDLDEVQADAEATGEDLAEAQRNVASTAIDARASLADLVDENGNLKVSADEARQQLAKLGLPPAVVEQIMADLGAVLDELEAVDRIDPNVLVTVDSAEALRRLDELNRKIQQVAPNITITPDLNVQAGGNRARSTGGASGYAAQARRDAGGGAPVAAAGTTVNVSPTYNVTVNVDGGMDERAAEQVGDELVRLLEEHDRELIDRMLTAGVIR